MAIRNHRYQIMQDVNLHPELEQVERRKCAMDPAYFVTMYGYLYEPRNNNGRGGYRPWIPFERQIQMIRWFQACMTADDEKADGVLSKCRDVGASWMMCAMFTWMWLYVHPFNGLLVSQKEMFVDSRHPKSLFWKIDKLIQFLPTFLKPPGFSTDRHRNKLFLENPENGNVIGGESTNSNAARAERATMIFFDEAAQIPDFMNIWMSAADSTEHRFAVSTESMDQGPDFYNLRAGIDADYHPSIFTIDYWEHPLHDDIWYERQVKRFAADPDMLQQEIHRNPHTHTHFVYPPMREKFPQDDVMYMKGNPLFCTIDPGFDDNTAIVWIQYNTAEARYEIINGYTNARVPAAFYGPILTGKMHDTEGNLVEGDWFYSDYDLEMIDWVRNLGTVPKYIGDMYGDNQNGASADTWYSVWLKQQGIRINTDRLPSGKLAAHRMIARSHPGRRDALKWIMPRLAFGGTLGARQVLVALQNNKFNKPTASGRISESGMLRDSTTHYTSAVEYWAANMKMQDQLMQYANDRQTRQSASGQDTRSRQTRYGTGVRELQEIR